MVSFGRYIALLFPFFGFSQFIITGNIETSQTDLNGVNLQGFHVQILDKNAQLKAFSLTDSKGYFSLKIDRMGNYSLQLNDLEFEAQSISINLDINSKKKQYFKLPIQRKSIELLEVRIENKRFTEKKDTIVFNAKAYAKGNEKVVEDLLKRIPGVEVDPTGKILVKGKEVEKIMVEGDDFFERGYRMLSQNMPSDAIDKVEVLDHFSHNRLLKGFENSEKVALNLKLEEGTKYQWFGNADLKNATFPENRYEINANLMSFGIKSKHYFLTNFNDLGKNPSGDLEVMYKIDMSSVGDDFKNHLYLKSSPFIQDIDESKYLFNQAKIGSLNSIFNISDKLKTKTRITFKRDKIDFYQNKRADYLIDSLQLTNNQRSNYINDLFYLNANLNLENNITKNSILLFDSNYNLQSHLSNEFLEFNEVSSQNKIPLRSHDFDQKLSYTNQIHKRTVFLINLRYKYQNNQENADFQSDESILENLFDGIQVYNIEESLKRKLNFIGVEGKLIKKLRKEDLLEGKISFQNYTNNFVISLLGNSESVGMVTPVDFQNDLMLKAFNLSGTLNYSRNFGRKWKWNNTVGINVIKYTYKDFFILKKPTESSSPILSSELIFKPTIKQTIKVSSRYDSWSTDYSQVYENYIYMGRRSFSHGLNGLGILPFWNTSFEYLYGRIQDKFNLSFNISYDNQFKYQSYYNEISDEFDISKTVLLKDRKNWKNSLIVSYYFSSLNHFLKLSFSGNQSQYQNYINSENLRDVESRGYTYGFTINSAYNKSFINYSLSNTWYYRKFITSSHYSDEMKSISYFDINMSFSQNLFLKSSQQLYHYPQLTGKKAIIFLI